MSEATATFDSWGLVELMGHQRIAGRITEAEIGGSKFVRVDVPEVNGKQAFTRFLGPSAIYAINPMDEESARLCATQAENSPVSEWSARELLKRADAAEAERKALPRPHGHDVDDEDDDEDEELTTHD